MENPAHFRVEIYIQGFRRRNFMVFNVILTGIFSTLCYWLLIGLS
jgi:hypothetical protein